MSLRSSALLLAVILTVGVSASQAKGLKDWHKSAAQYLLKKKEIKKFKKLKSDGDRQAYIDAFWKKLDPFPETPESEAKEAFEERLQIAEKSFGEGGWDSEPGQVLILLGAPIKSEAEGGAGDSTNPGPIKLIWTYPPGSPGTNGNEVIEFAGAPPRITLETEGLDLSIDTFVASVKARKAPPMEKPVEEAPQPVQEAAPQGDPADIQIREVLMNRELSDDILLEVVPFYLPSSDGNIYMPIGIEADFSLLDPSDGPRSVHVFGAFFNDSGEPFRNFSIPYEVSASDTTISIFKSDVTVPGHYTALIGVRDSSGQYGLNEVEIQTPDMTQLSTSTVIFAAGADPNAGVQEDLLNKITESIFFGPMEVKAFVTPKLDPDEDLQIFYFIFGTQSDPATQRPKIQINYDIQQNGKSVKKFKLAELQEPAAFHPFSLDGSSLKPGPAQIVATIEDKLAGTSIEKVIPIIIE